MPRKSGYLYQGVLRNRRGEPMIISRAKAFRTWLEEMTIYIQDREIIVGNKNNTPGPLLFIRKQKLVIYSRKVWITSSGDIRILL
jgi:hypothetical protein